MRKWIHRLGLAAAVLCLMAAVGAFSVYRMSRWQPAFYDSSVQVDRQQAASAGDQFERKILAVHNEVVDDRGWRIAILEEQVNGWLATVLPEKFPEMLPDFVQDPRVQFRAGQAELACRYVGPRFSAVASVVVEPFLTEQPNVIALRIRQARLGALPGLKKRLVERASREARRRGFPLQWTQVDSDPVALLTLDAPATSQRADLRLEVLQLSAGQLVIGGQGSHPIETPNQGESTDE